MKPGPDTERLPQTRDRERVDPQSGHPQAEAFVLLTDDQRSLIVALQLQRDGMTVRQLQARLSLSSGEVTSLLETALERRLVARLNTVVPSYVYRYNGVDLDAD